MSRNDIINTDGTIKWDVIGGFNEQLADIVKPRKLQANEELNTILQTYDVIAIDEGVFNVTVPLTSLANKTIIGISKEKSILKLSDTAFLNLLNADCFKMKDVQLQVSVNNAQTILQLVSNHPIGINSIRNIHFDNVKILAVDYSLDQTTPAHYFVQGKYTGLSLEAVNPYGIYNSYFDLEIVNSDTAFKVVSHNPSTNDGWITTCDFKLQLNNFNTVGIDLETSNFFTNTFNLKIQDLGNNPRTALKFGPNVMENFIESIVLFKDGGSGFTLINCDATAYKNRIRGDYLEGSIVGYDYLVGQNTFDAIWNDVDNAGHSNGVVMAELKPTPSNIFGNGNLSSIFMGKYYTAVTACSYTRVADTSARFGQVLRITSTSASAYVNLNCDPPLQNLQGKMVTFVAKVRTTNKNVCLALSYGSAGAVTGKYHSGSGNYELLTVTGIIKSNADAFNPMIQLKDPAGCTADVEWCVVSMGTYAPTQYVPHQTLLNFKEYRSAPPTVGTFNQGDILWNSSPTIGSPIGWVCSTGGTPGTWTPFGYIRTSGFGIATIASGTNSITVNHGLSGTPSNVTATPQGNIGAWWISSIGSSQFTINCTTTPGSNTVVSWRAEV